MYKVFELLKKETSPGDEIFLYWNGHGGGDLPAQDNREADRFDEYLVLYDTTGSADPDVNKSIRKTSITDDDMGVLIASLAGRKINAIFETCHSGGLMERSTSRSTSRSIDNYKPALIDVQTFAELAAFNPYRNGVVSILEQPQYRSVVEQYESSLRSSRPETVPDRPATETTTRESDILDLLPLGAKSVSTPRRLTHFMSHFSQKAKDISPDQQNLNVVFACAEDEGARAGMFLKDEDGKVKRIPVNPVAFAYCLTMSNKEKKPVKFEEFVPFLQQVVSYNISILKEVVDEADRDKVQQTPQIIANMKDAWIRPPQTNER